MIRSFVILLALTHIIPAIGRNHDGRRGHCRSVTIPSGKSQQTSPDGTCGGVIRYSCTGADDGPCCGQWGWCGSTPEYCGTGCQESFGSCTGASSTTPPVSSSRSHPQSASSKPKSVRPSESARSSRIVPSASSQLSSLSLPTRQLSSSKPSSSSSTQLASSNGGISSSQSSTTSAGPTSYASNSSSLTLSQLLSSSAALPSSVSSSNSVNSSPAYSTVSTSILSNALFSNSSPSGAVAVTSTSSVGSVSSPVIGIQSSSSHTSPSSSSTGAQISLNTVLSALSSSPSTILVSPSSPSSGVLLYSTSSSGSSSTSTSTASGATLTGITATVIQSPASCYTLPTPTASLVDVLSNQSTVTINPLMDFFMNNNATAPQYIASQDPDDSNEVIVDFTALPDEIGIVIPGQQQILVNASGIFVFSADCSTVDALYIPNFFAQLDSTSSPQSSVKRSPQFSRRDAATTFQAGVSLLSDCLSGQYSVAAMTPQLSYNGNTCPNSCAGTTNCLDQATENAQFFTCSIPDPDAWENYCETHVGSWYGSLSASSAWRVLGLIPVLPLKLAYPAYARVLSWIGNAQNVKKGVDALSADEMAGLLCLELRHHGYNTMDLVVEDGVKTGNPWNLIRSLGTPIAGTSWVYMYEDQQGFSHVRCSCTSLTTVPTDCTTTLCQKQFECNVDQNCPPGLACLDSACCGKMMCFNPSTCDFY